MTAPQTVLTGFLDLVDQDPEASVAMDKRLGRWRSRTRGELLADVATLAAAFGNLGIGRGVTVLTATADRFDWLSVDLALQAQGARVCPVPAAASDASLEQALSLSGATHVVARGQHLVDRLLTLEEAGSVGRVERILYQDAAGLAEYQDERLTGLDELRARSDLGDTTRELRSSIDAQGESDAAILSISAGAEGAPRVTTLTHGALYLATRAVIETFELGPKDRLLAYRPLADPTERTTTIYASLLSGALLALAETREDVRAAMYEIAPTFLHLTPRLVDDVLTEVSVRLQAARGLKGAVGARWLASNRGEDPRSPGLLDRALVTFPVLEKLGLDKARTILVSGSEVSPGARRQAISLGLPLRTAFATSAVGGIVSASEPGDLRPGACGVPLPGFELDLTEAGELIVGGPAAPGSVPTGDAALLDDGSLLLRGRLNERLDLGDGVVIDLLEVESTLRSSPYIREAVVARQPDGATVVAVELAEGPTARWASKQGLAFVTYRSLVALPEVVTFAQQEVASALEQTPLHAADEVRVLPAKLEALPGTLVAGEKVRRDAVMAEALAVDVAATSPTPG